LIFQTGLAEQTQQGAKQNFAERSNRMNRTYEIMFIVRPDVEEADLDKLIEGFSSNITGGGGEVKSVEKMGRRRLAYTVRKFNDGFYVLLNVAAAGSLIAEIERRLRVSEQVIKFITVRMDEEEKRLAKVKAIRDTKVKRSAQPIAQPHQAPAAAPNVDAHAPAAAASETEEEKKPVATAPAEHVPSDAPPETAAAAV
jgi:small subunit ribosomal protein S6